MLILGVSCYFHDSAAVLLKDGEIIYAFQEERFSRIKHDNNFPEKSIQYILKKSNLTLDEIDYICYYEKPFLKFDRIIETAVDTFPWGYKLFSMSLPIWLKTKLFTKNEIIKSLKKIGLKELKNKLVFSEHHLSHAASAFYPSPFEKSIILTMDGVGEWSTSTIAIGEKNKINMIKEIKFPHSLGLLYSAFTYYLGFKVNSGEYKLMGLAPYGKPIFNEIIKDELIDIKDDGSFRLNMKYFDYIIKDKMINSKFERLFGSKARIPEKEKLTKFHMNIAASIQDVLEEVIIKICKSLKNDFNIQNLCLAGGVALNCVANGKILKENIFKNVWVQPAAGDAGGALGACYNVWHQLLNNNRNHSDISDKMKGCYLGNSFTENEIKEILDKKKIKYERKDSDKTIEFVSDKIIKGKVVGWFQGRMEFGPRALGNRSILADPRNHEMQKNLNLKIKFRESFRPFAPIIMFEEQEKWFGSKKLSPYMMFTYYLRDKLKVKVNDKDLQNINNKRSIIPAVTHLDYSARIQSVSQETNSKLYDLLKSFYSKTGCPVLINTSFNIRGEPIVCEIEDALNCFFGTGIDYLICENFVIDKKKQSQLFDKDYKEKFKLD